MRFYLIIKGDALAALQAVADRKLEAMGELGTSHGSTKVHIWAGPGMVGPTWNQLADWFAETQNPPFPDGSLLFFAQRP